MIKETITKVKEFINSMKRTATASYKDLTWPERILKTVLVTVGTFIVIGLFLTVGLVIVMFYVFMAVATSLGGGIENGMNEAMGRNKYRRY